jgi:hypothetical protein
MSLSKYMPTQNFTLDFNADIGQRFIPSEPGRGFNFASLPNPLDEYVMMPGTVYPTNDTKIEDDMTDNWQQSGETVANGKALETAPTSPEALQPSTPPRRGNPASRQYRDPSVGAERHSWAPENLNVRVVLEHQYPQQLSESRRYSYSPLSNQEPSRYPSIRRRKSRTGLKEYGARQALHDFAHDRSTDKDSRTAVGGRLNG